MILSADETKLGSNYHYLPGYEAVDVGYPEGAVIYKSEKAYIFNDVKIHGNIVRAKKNKKFIIGIKKKDTTQSINDSLNILSKNDLRYFIIDKSKDLVYGPLVKAEYFRKRDELRIPKTLNL